MKRYLILHKKTNEVLRISRTPPEIEDDTIRLDDGEMRGINKAKIEIREVEVDQEIPDVVPEEGPTPSLEDLPIKSSRSLSLVGDRERERAMEEVRKIFLEKLLRSSPTLWIEYQSIKNNILNENSIDDIRNIINELKNNEAKK